MLKSKVILFLSVILFTACATVGQVPMDDAYYWENNTGSSYSEEIAPGAGTQSVAPSAPKPSPIEYTNVQDTTVTIRIKR